MCIFPLSGICGPQSWWTERLSDMLKEKFLLSFFFFPMSFMFSSLTKDALRPGMRLLLCNWYNWTRACSIPSLWLSQQNNSIAPSQLTQLRHAGPGQSPEILKQLQETRSIPPVSGPGRQCQLKELFIFLYQIKDIKKILMHRYWESECCLRAFFLETKITSLEKYSFLQHDLIRMASFEAIRRLCLSIPVKSILHYVWSREL